MSHIPSSQSRYSTTHKHATPEDRLLRRAKSEFREMPGLMLTEAQAGRLWGLDLHTCQELLSILEGRGFLRRTPNGYIKA